MGKELKTSGPVSEVSGTKFGLLVLMELTKWQLLLLLLLLARLEGSRLGRLAERTSGRSILELRGSRRRVLVFKASRRRAPEPSGSSRMVLEWGLMLLVTGASARRFTDGSAEKESRVWSRPSCGVMGGLAWWPSPLPGWNQPKKEVPGLLTIYERKQMRCPHFDRVLPLTFSVAELDVAPYVLPAVQVKVPASSGKTSAMTKVHIASKK